MSKNSPNPNWKPGHSSVSPLDQTKEMVSLDPKTLDVTPTYKLLIGTVVPRPIAFISTINKNGQGNLAPFSFFNGVSTSPPCLMIAITQKEDHVKKDTLRNIEETGEFVINTVSEWMAEAVNHCSALYPYGVSEMEKAGLTPLPSEKVAPPRVKEAPIQMECKLYNSMKVGDGKKGSSTIVVGEVVQFHIHPDVYQNGKILIEPLKPISRLAGFSYGRTTETFDIPRPTIE